MKKINIIRKNEDFLKVIKNNRPYKNNYFLLFVLKNDVCRYRFGISISKKVGNAVTRNRIKRQIKSILDENKKRYKKDYDCIIIVDRKIINLTFFEIRENLNNLILKANILD